MENNENNNHHEPAEINYRGWKAMPFVIGNEIFEKLGAIGTLSNLLIYLTTVFNMKSITAANILNIFHGTTNLATMIGAFLSDTYFGRCKTLAYASIATLMGLVVIDLTAAIKKLHSPHCGDKDNETCRGPTTGQMSILLAGFGFLIVGAGGIRPCTLAFGADQFNPKTESGKRGIESFFNWYFFTFTLAQMISLTFIVYVQSNVSWALGFAIPAILMFISCVLFFIGWKIFVKVKVNGSPITSLAQVIAVSIRKRKLKLPEQPWMYLFNFTSPNSINSKLPYTFQFRFLDKAASRTPDDEIKPEGSAGNPWRLCSIQQVEEVKCVLRVLPIWFSAVIYHIAMVQQHTYSVFQALQSDRRLGNGGFEIPAASYYVFLMLSMTLWIPIYDRIVAPFAKKHSRGGITLLQRIGLGILLNILCTLVSAQVEQSRRTTALSKPNLRFVQRKGAVSSMSATWLALQLAIAGVSEAFTWIGEVEFYYKQFPENMRSVAGALFFCGMAVSNYSSSFLISVVHRTTGDGIRRSNWLSEDLNKGRLDYFYYLICGIEVLNLAYFLVISKWYKYKGSGLDIVGNGASRSRMRVRKKVMFDINFPTYLLLKENYRVLA